MGSALLSVAPEIPASAYYRKNNPKSSQKLLESSLFFFTVSLRFAF